MQIPLARPDIGPAEEEAVLDVLRSGVLSMGRWTERFEAAVAERAGTRHAVACSSGTAGLHLLLASLGLGPGDEVITPSFSFIASSNAILHTGARPVFADIDEETLCVDPAEVEASLSRQTRALLPVDIFGHPAALDQLRATARARGLPLVEDACEAMGAELNGIPCGNGQYADGAVFAFYPNKQITTGEGGMIVTDDDLLAERCRSLRNHGREEGGAWLSHTRLGYNYRMDELSAALGTAQMERLDQILGARAAVAEAYTERLHGRETILPLRPGPGARISWFVYVVRLHESIDRDAVMMELLSQGIGCRPYFTPIHLQPFYQRDFGYRPGDLPVTERVAQTTLALPFHNHLTEAEIDWVVEALTTAVAKHRMVRR